MLDIVPVSPASPGGHNVGTDKIAGTDWEVVKTAFGEEGDLQLASDINPLPVTDVDAEASLASLEGKDFATQNTLALLLAKVSGDQATETTLADILTKLLGSIAVTGTQTDALTNAELRATPVPVSGTITATGGLNDAELRATPIPVSGTVTANTGLTQPLTDAQLRATPVPISGAGDATAANQTTGNTSLGLIKTNTDKIPALGQALAASSVPIVLTAAQLSTLTPPAAITGFLTETDFDTKAGALTETAPATDIASSGINGRLQRIAQRITSLISALGSPFQAGGLIGNTTFAVTNAGTFAVQATQVPDASATYAPSNATTTAYASNLVIKASAGVLYQVTGYNSRTSSQFIQLHNATSLPADTAIPVITFTIPPQDNFSLDFSRFGRYFSTGIVICNSSTGATKTIGISDVWFDAQFK